MKDLVEFVARTLADQPDAVRVREGGDRELVLELAPDDVGRVIGRRGRTAKALRTLLQAGGGYQLEIAEPPETAAE